MVYTFNPSTGKADPGGSWSLRPAWSAEQVQGQSSLGSEGNNQTQKAGEDVIEFVVHLIMNGSINKFRAFQSQSPLKGSTLQI